MAMSRQSSSAPENILIVTPFWKSDEEQTTSAVNQKLAEIFTTERFKIFATTLNEDKLLSGTNGEYTAASSSGVILIGSSKPRGPKEAATEQPQTSWLKKVPHCYFRKLPKKIQNGVATTIIAVGPQFAWGALNIKDAFFPDARVLVINNILSEEGFSERTQADAIEWASEVDMVVTTEEKIFSDSQKVFRRSTKRIPHSHVPLNEMDLTTLGLNDKRASLDEVDGGCMGDVTEQLKALALSPKPKITGQTWHKSMNQDVDNFHEAFARYPETEIKKMRMEFESKMKVIELKLRDLGLCERFEFTGSAYEKVMINAKDIEFDLMIIMSKGHDLSHEPLENGPEGYFLLKPNPGEDVYDKYLASAAKPVISPEKVVNSFFGILQKVLNERGFSSTSILRKHGPAIQLDVYEDKGKTKKMFSVDIVPAFQITSPQETEPMLFVAKPFKSKDTMYAWRRSFSVEEKREFKSIDTDNGCRRMCVRMLKVLTKPTSQTGKTGPQDSSLNNISSFMIKNALFHVNRENQSMDWNKKKIGERLLRIFEQMAEYFESGFFPHFFLPGHNLIGDMKEDLRKNLTTRLRRLCNSEKEFRKAINALPEPASKV